MELEDVAAEVRPGRLFLHRTLNDPMTGGPLYCRIRAVEGELVEYETIYHRDDGSERIGSPWRVMARHFVVGTFGGWYEGTNPPPAMPRAPGGEPAVELGEERLREAVLARCRAERIEPAGRIDRILGSALASFERQFTATISGRVTEASAGAQFFPMLSLVAPPSKSKS